ncbi:DUF4062 domain-containing protein [Accumulibacter sp.]|uniref:DUF4062 domain-containing protein n=1 Tax=Accumulibacter sp. TaxID=2053492 RepID=UPI0026175901|nr:DUF4062 domain-containing protein [Accumulibacter sp.]
MKLYLSSTLSDLEAERQAVKEALSGRYGYNIVDSYEADPRPLWESCIADVQACDAYLGIVGLRYGFVPPGQSKSITELEFDAAGEAGKERYLFLKSEEARFLPKDMDSHTGENEGGQRIRRLRDRLQSAAGDLPRLALFTDPAALKVAVLRALPPSSSPRPEVDAGDDSGHDRIPPPPADATELQRMLHDHLHKHWRDLSRNKAFSGASLFEELPRPLTADKIFRLAREDEVERLLVLAPEYFTGKHAASWFSATAQEGAVCSAFLRIVLVAAERHFHSAGAIDTDTDDPVLETAADRMVSLVQAAARFGFGLCLLPGMDEPANVFPLHHPVAEFGNPGEQGLPLTNAELSAAIERKLPELGKNFTSGYLRWKIKLLEKRLGTSLVAMARPEGRFAQADARCALRDHLGTFDVRLFFPRAARDELNAWVHQVADDLSDTFASIFSRAAANLPRSEASPPAAGGDDAV